MAQNHVAVSPPIIAQAFRRLWSQFFTIKGNSMKWNAAVLTTNTLQIYLRPLKGYLLLDEALLMKKVAS